MRARDGFTVLETLVALTLAAVVIAAALVMMRTQIRSFTIGSDRTELTMMAQFASALLERELRTAGTNVLSQQPWLVYAGPDVIAFNADLTSRVADPFAVYVDPDVAADASSAMRRTQRVTLPRTSFAYPDTTYWAAPQVVGSAELIVFYFQPDSTTARTDDHVLMRRVNAGAAETIARGLLRNGSEPFFQYFQTARAADGFPAFAAVSAGRLPLAHRVPLHLSPGDTGTAALADSVRAVRFSFSATNGATGADERRLTRSELIWLRNGGLARQRTCGAVPIFDSAVNVAIRMQDGSPAVRLRWSASVDEQAGEEDVIRYVVWRTAGGGVLGDPLLSVPAGSASYEYLDTSVQPGESWSYSVAAQDCTPNLSPTRGSGVINVP